LDALEASALHVCWKSFAMGSRTGITVSDDERQRLEAVVEDGNSKQKHVWRAQIILASADGCGTMEIMRRTGVSKPTIWRWQARFLEQGVNGLLRDATRPPGKAPVSKSKVREVLELTRSPPPGEATHWTLRAMAAQVGLAWSTVRLIWRKHGLVPHRFRTFKLSRDPAFAERVHDVVGLYVNPPEHAAVLSIDEKSQIQALGRTQNPLPMKAGQPETRTHDYKRNGTTTLFAALNILDGTVIGQHYQKHRQDEFISFLDHTAAQFPDREVHAILDNYSTHKTANVHQWLADHPNWTFHFIPTSSSWLNAVEGFFAKLTRRRLKHAIFQSVQECELAILRFIAEHNARGAKPFRWTADPDKIIAARKRGFALIDSHH
jgi:transposase